MSRAVLLYLLLVAAPAGALGWFAFRVADGDLARRLAEHRASLEGEAERLAGGLEAAIGEAMEQAVEDDSTATGYARDGRWLGFTPPSERAAAEPTTLEKKLYEVSLRGGESFEHAYRDPARALDAYAFYLHRLRSPALRARLQLGAARSALALGDTALDNTALGETMLRELSQAPAWLDSEEGVPIALIARRLRGESAPDLERLWRSRRRLEEAVMDEPELLTSLAAVLNGQTLFFARDLGGGEREIRAVELALPVLAAPGREVAFVPARSADGAASTPDLVLRPVRLRGQSTGSGALPGPVLGELRLADPSFEAKRAEASRQRDILRALVILLVVVTLAGGVALAFYLSRERKLARLRAQLLANVSHELKSPVTSIRIFAEMLVEDGTDAEQARRYGRHLAAEGQRLSQLVENLLDVSRPDRKATALAREPVDLAALLRRVAEGFAFQAKEKRVELATAGLDAGEVIAETNAPAVERIVLNLLDNAVKYRRAETPSVRLQLASNCDTARIAVADNGIGIPRRDQERVFEEFYRVRYDDYAVKGSGLGLSIARRLARQLGGNLRLESREGAGSTFTLEVPLVATDASSDDDSDSRKANARQNPDR